MRPFTSADLDPWNVLAAVRNSDRDIACGCIRSCIGT
jgi:hypothetical protein